MHKYFAGPVEFPAEVMFVIGLALTIFAAIFVATTVYGAKALAKRSNSTRKHQTLRMWLLIVGSLAALGLLNTVVGGALDTWSRQRQQEREERYDQCYYDKLPEETLKKLRQGKRVDPTETLGAREACKHLR